MSKIRLTLKPNWRNDPISQKQIDKIEQMEEDLGLNRRRTMELIGNPSLSLTNLTKGEASDLISLLEDSY